MPSAHLHIKTYEPSVPTTRLPELVLLHGWGVNGAVFEPLTAELPEYRIHCVDLPGFGDSDPIEGDIHAWVEVLSKRLPQSAIYIGWSLGGLVASQLALTYPQQVKALVTIASSPCFMAQEHETPPWLGIAPKVLSQFSEQLTKNLSKTVERFLAIQAMGSETAKKDIINLKHLVLSKPLPNRESLAQGLSMLQLVDLRSQLENINQPWLRIWGKLDGLVPRRMVEMLNSGDNVNDVMLLKASHAPFISHLPLFLDHFRPWLGRFER